MATRLAAQRTNFVSSPNNTSSVTMTSSPPQSLSNTIVASASSTSNSPSPPATSVIGTPTAMSPNTQTTTTMLTAEDLANAVVINGTTASVNGNLLILEESHHSPTGLKGDPIPISLQHVIPQVGDEICLFSIRLLRLI